MVLTTFSALGVAAPPPVCLRRGSPSTRTPLPPAVAARAPGLGALRLAGGPCCHPSTAAGRGRVQVAVRAMEKKKRTVTKIPKSKYTTQVHSPGELDILLTASKAKKDPLVVLMVKKKSCPACNAAMPSWNLKAEHYRDTKFVELVGDESADTIAMVKAMEIPVTPMFVFYRGGEEVGRLRGGDKEKLTHEIRSRLREGERGQE